MPELAAHLERVVKETAKLCAEDVNSINFNRGHVLGDIRGEYDHVMPTAEMAKVIEWRVAAALAACAREARNEALEQAAHICDFAADGTTEQMSEDGHSEEWKIIAENSVEQYHSMARNIRRLRERAVGEKGRA